MTPAISGTKLVPLGDRVVLRRIDDDQSRRSIHLPGVAEEDQTSQECEVVEMPFGGSSIVTKSAIGGQFSRTLSIGDRVYIAKHKGYGVLTNAGEEFIVVDAVDILCVEEDAFDHGQKEREAF